jgi:hypothetical protein
VQHQTLIHWHFKTAPVNQKGHPLLINLSFEVNSALVRKNEELLERKVAAPV